MDLIDRIKNEMKHRLEELRPQIEQIPRLEQALRALDLSDSGARETSAPARRGARAGARRRGATTRRRSTGGTRGARTRVSGQQRREQLLGLVREDPTIGVRDLAARMGTTPNNVYNIIRRLEAEGQLSRREGRFTVRS